MVRIVDFRIAGTGLVALGGESSSTQLDTNPKVNEETDKIVYKLCCPFTLEAVD
jgi:hypothetical protein